MFLTPQSMLFFSGILSSIILMLSSSSLLITWIALELNTMSFIPLLILKKINNSEAAVKYFLTQTLASVIFLLTIIIPWMDTQNNYMYILISSAMMIKLGAAPFHSWLPSMVERLSWTSMFILLTIQKVNPLIILILIPISPTLLMNLFIYSSLIVGALMGLSQTQTRKILTYSSINHVGWLISTTMMNMPLVGLYYISYTFLLIPIMQIINKINMQKIYQTPNSKIMLNLSMLMFLTMLSLGGLPPFMGFLPKWIALQTLMMTSSYLMVSLMIMTSLITLMFYLRLTFSAFLLNKNNWMKPFNSTIINNSIILSSSISLMGLMITFLM